MKNDEIQYLPPLVVKYLRYLEGALNKSNLTVLEYGSDLRLFFKYIKAVRNGIKLDSEEFEKLTVNDVSDELIFSLTLEDAYEFLSYCKNNRNNDASARARKVISLKRFYRYLETHGYTKTNNMAFLESPKAKKAMSKYLTLEQAVSLLNAPSGPHKERDFCILTLFMNCGLRLAELVNINLSDISFENRTIRILGKGNKERIVYLNDSCVSALNDYLKKRPNDGLIDRDALFVSNRRTRISRESVQKMVEKYLDKIGLGNLGLSVHKLRHTAATLMYQFGKTDVLELKKLLGHENLSTTEIYTHVNDDEVRKAVDNNPLNLISNTDKDDD